MWALSWGLIVLVPQLTICKIKKNFSGISLEIKIINIRFVAGTATGIE